MNEEKSGVFKFRFDSSSETLDSQMNKSLILKKLLRSLSPYKWKIFLFFLVTIAYSATYVVFPRMLGVIIDIFSVSLVKYILGFGDDTIFKEIIPYVVNVVVFFVANSLFAFLQGHLISDIVSLYSLSIRNSIMDKFNQLSVHYIDSSNHNQLLSCLTADVDALNQSMNLLFMQLVSPVILFIAIIIMQLSLNVFLGFITLLFCGFGTVLIFVFGKKEMKCATKYQESSNKLKSEVSEFYKGLSVIQLSGKLNEKIKCIINLNKIVENDNKKAKKASVFQNCISDLCMVLCLVAATVTGAFFMKTEALSVGGLQCQFVYIRRLFSSFSSFTLIPGIVRTTFVSAGRIFDFFDIADCENYANKYQLPDTLSETLIEFKNVSFSYSSEGKSVLKDVSFKIKRTGITALTGITGAGKTTIIKLILGFYAPCEGQIFYNGNNVSYLEKDSYLSKFNIVVQGASLFHDTIANNIAYGCENVTYEQIRQAAIKCGADDFISGMEHGYDTVFNSYVPNLSVGEIQLVLLARAFLKKTDVFVFDEATSGIDVVTEKKILNALIELSKDSCVVLIAHRRSAIARADNRIVISDAKTIQMNIKK